MTAGGDTLDALTRVLRPDAPADGPPPLPPARWDAMIALANRHLLGPALHVAAGRADHVDAGALDYLAMLHAMNRRRNAAIRRQAVELVQALNDDGIAPMLLKGALVLMAPPRIGRGARMMSDIDLAVPAGAAAPALAVLDRLGYRLHERYPEGHHAYGEFMREGDPASVDPHFELIDQRDVLPAAEIWERAARVAYRGLDFRTPCPTDRLLHNLLHAQIHHRGNFYRGAVDLRQLYEFATLAAAFGADIDWSFIRERMARHKLLTPLESYLFLARRLFGTAWPYAEPPTIRARLHAGRCLVQLRHPALDRLAAPAGNLRAGFAWHRMCRLYRDYGGGPMTWRWRHLCQFLARHGAVFAFDRLFRT
jgi:hypothetical protein